MSIAFPTVHGSTLRSQEAALRSVPTADWVAALIITGTLILATATTATVGPMPRTGAAIIGLGLLALIGRRYQPLPAAVATAVVVITSVVTAPQGVKAPVLVAIALVAYSLVRYESGGRLIAGMLVCIGGVAMARLALPDERAHGVTLTQLEVALVLLPAVTAGLVRVRRVLGDLLVPGSPWFESADREPQDGQSAVEDRVVAGSAAPLLTAGRSLTRWVDFGRANRDRVLSTIALGLVLLVLILQGLRGAAPSADPALARDLAAIALGMIAVGSIALIGRWPWPALLLALVAAVGFTGMATRPDAYNTVIGGVVVIGLPLILGGLLRRRPASIALGSCLAAIVLMGLVADATGVGTYGAADTCQEVLSSLALAVGAWSAGRVLRHGSAAAWTRTLRTAADPPRVLLPDAGELVLQASALGLRPTMIRVEPLPDEAALEPRTVDVVRNVLREGLSNAARHAPGADLTISMLAEGAAVRIDVVNGPVSGEAGLPGGSGRGIPTLAQRVAAVGGMLWVGPASGGFALRARVPLTRLPQLRDDDHDRLLDAGANPDR